MFGFCTVFCMTKFDSEHIIISHTEIVYLNCFPAFSNELFTPLNLQCYVYTLPTWQQCCLFFWPSTWAEVDIILLACLNSLLTARQSGREGHCLKPINLHAVQLDSFPVTFLICSLNFFHCFLADFIWLTWSCQEVHTSDRSAFFLLRVSMVFSTTQTAAFTFRSSFSLTCQGTINIP